MGREPEAWTSVFIPPLVCVISIIPYLNGSRAVCNSFGLHATVPRLINKYEGEGEGCCRLAQSAGESL